MKHHLNRLEEDVILSGAEVHIRNDSKELKHTSVNGSFSVSPRLSMAMRATQKKRISWPVARTLPGKKR